MQREQLKLHSAIVAVLVDLGPRAGAARWLTGDEIASTIALYDLYRRPSDGHHPPSGQVLARARQYPDIFERRAGKARTEVRLRRA